MSKKEKLAKLKKLGKNHRCLGMDEPSVKKFLKTNEDLNTAIDFAYEKYETLKTAYKKIFALPDYEQVKKLQEGFVNFYDPDTVNPYVAIAAKGPWIIASNGAVIHDSGGYGMLGFGHNPSFLSDALSGNAAMANIMTAQFTHLQFSEAMQKEIGHTRKSPPYSGFMCLNSGSEAMTLALRLVDLNTKNVFDRLKVKQKKTAIVSLSGGFHGRTDRPSRISHSSLPNYQKHLASFQGPIELITCKVNDTEHLEEIFRNAKKDDVFIEACVFEPVMGEGNPGLGITAAFYEKAHMLCEERSALMVIDSIQAGLRAHGVLSICDYPGFQKLKAPNIECFSKALNAGQFPLSVVALAEETAKSYHVGLYGNTMTANPRAMQVATRVLSQLTKKLRSNINEKGKIFLDGLRELQRKYPQIIEYAQGTGLLFSLAINPKTRKVIGATGLEHTLRCKGLGVIHGGKNALRFTPHFAISDDEVKWVLETLESALKT